MVDTNGASDEKFFVLRKVSHRASLDIVAANTQIPESSLGLVLSERQVGEQEPSYEARFFISSLPPRVRAFARAVRNHWGIENSLHWHLDVTFGEDKSRIRQRRGAENFALLRRLALSLLKQHPAKTSVACKRLAAALDSDFLEEILQPTGNSEKP